MSCTLTSPYPIGVKDRELDNFSISNIGSENKHSFVGQV